MQVSAQARAAARVEIHVAVDHEQAQPAEADQDSAQRREFPQVKLARTVRCGFGYRHRPLGHGPGEPRIGGGHHGRAGGTLVVDVRGREEPVSADVTGLHPSRVAQRARPR